MWTCSQRARLATLFALVLALPGSAGALDILLTNDDGVDAPGIQILRGALLAAGHDVTVVAPAVNQSGTGGSLNTDVGATVAVTDLGDGRFSVDSTPSDTIRAALGVVLAGPPDLVISGLNFGQNLGQTSSNASGTIGAALTAL